MFEFSFLLLDPACAFETCLLRFLLSRLFLGSECLFLFLVLGGEGDEEDGEEERDDFEAEGILLACFPSASLEVESESSVSLIESESISEERLDILICCLRFSLLQEGGPSVLLSVGVQ